MSNLHRRVATGAAAVAAGTLVVKVLGAAREILLARTFGTAAEVDAFLVAFAVPSVVVAVFAVAFQSAFVPAHVDAVARRGHAAGDRLLLQAGVLSVAIALVVAGAMAMLRVPFVQLVGSGFDADKSAYAASLLLLFLPMIPLGCAAAVLATVLQAREQFFRAAVVPVITPAVVIGILVAVEHPSIRELVVAIVVSSLIELAVLASMALPHTSAHVGNVFEADPATRTFLRQSAPLVGYAFFVNVAVIVDQAFAATQSGGSVAALAYANRIPMVTFAVLLGALGTAVLPSLSRIAATGDRDALLVFVRRQSVVVAAGAIVITALLVVASRALVEVIFDGSQLGDGVLTDVVQTQQLYLLQVPFLAVNTLLLRALSARLDNTVTFWVGALGFAVNVALDALLVGPFGIEGVALSSALVQMVLLPVLLLGVWHRRSGPVPQEPPGAVLSGADSPL